jgi:hypothetical protein
MNHNIDPEHPLHLYFRELVHESLTHRVGLRDSEDVESYVAALLVSFMHNEKIFALKDPFGNRIESLSEMLAEGDILMNADSFEREREVHRHVGDFLLFWSGLFPEMLPRLPGFSSCEPEIEAMIQGSESYEIVSSFDHSPFDTEAPLFKKLSEEFPACQYGLKLMRASFDGFRRQGWVDGFEA